MKHGLDKKFSTKGVKLVIEYFKGCEIKGFLPSYVLKNGTNKSGKNGTKEKP